MQCYLSLLFQELLFCFAQNRRMLKRSGFRSGLDALHFGERDGHLGLSRGGSAGDGMNGGLDLDETLFEALLQKELFFGAALRAGGQQQPHRHPAAAHAEQHGSGQFTGVQGPVEAHRAAVHEQQLIFSESFESRWRGVAHQQHGQPRHQNQSTQRETDLVERHRGAILIQCSGMKL